MVLLALLLIAFGAFILLSLLLVGLLEAPWPILLGLLFLGLYGLQRFSAESSLLANTLPLVSSPPRPPDQAHCCGDEMPLENGEGLVYRGVHYRRSEACKEARPTSTVPQLGDQPIKLPDSSPLPQSDWIEGIYRGKHWRRRLQESALTSPVVNASEVIYRGHKVKSSSPLPSGDSIGMTIPDTGLRNPLDQD
jgi:hypothetical protein